MVKVSFDWLLENDIVAFGGQITNKNVRQYVTTKFVETSLTYKGVRAVENGVYNKKKFVAVLPCVGLADCFV